MIALKDLYFDYKKKQPLFEGLNLKLVNGNIYGLLGKNGVGKTTLLKIIAGMLFPKQGNCTVFDYSPRNRLPQFLERLYFVPEEFYLPSISMKRFVTIYSPFYPKFDTDLLNNILKEFEISNKLQISELSFGEKKKFILAFALATNCRLLLFDEPTTGLDIQAKSIFRKQLAKLITDERIFIISTHQVRDLQNLIDPLIIIDNAMIIFNQSIHEVSERLSFQLSHTLPQDKEVLYSEKKLDGFITVTQNTGGMESNVDIEILYKTILSNQNTISEVFR